MEAEHPARLCRPQSPAARKRHEEASPHLHPTHPRSGAAGNQSGKLSKHKKRAEKAGEKKMPTTPFTAAKTKFHRCPHLSPRVPTAVKLCLRRRCSTYGHFFGLYPKTEFSDVMSESEN